jgi:N-acetylglutamate synthase-like GNAT family acetyltransferase
MIMVRKATLADIPGILQLVNENLGTLLPRTADDYAELIDMAWVAEKDGRVVGSCVLEIYSPKIAEIRSFVVHKDYRRQGFGKTLINTAVEEARKHNIREIMVVTSAREYFEKLNFGACLNEKFALFWSGS